MRRRPRMYDQIMYGTGAMNGALLFLGIVIASVIIYAVTGGKK